MTVLNEVLEALTNLGSSDTRSVADIKSLELFVIPFILQTQDSFKYLRFGSFKMTKVFETAAVLTEVNHQ